MARAFDRQVAGLQVRTAVLDRFTRLGTRLRSQCYESRFARAALKIVERPSMMDESRHVAIDRARRPW